MRLFEPLLPGMTTPTQTAPLPPLNALLLARALFKHAGSQRAAGALRTRYEAGHLDTAHLQRYNAALGFAADALPVTFYYLVAQRAHMATMLDPAFPFRIAGMIHAGNDITEHCRVDAGRPLVITTSVAIAPPKPSGAIHVVLDTAGEQDGQTRFTCRSDYVAVRGVRAARKDARHQEPVPGAQIASWTVDASAGRAYAAISGDWNPIHLWPWSARLMGLRAPIIHGMHTVARACAALEQDSGARLTAISARFRAPVPLQSEVRLFADPAGSAYTAVCSGRIAVEGAFTVQPP
ncbi:hypothetical protein GCM10027318_29820 [Massilia agilis]